MVSAAPSLCDLCGDPAVLLTPMEGFWVVEVEDSRKLTRAEIHAAPRRPALWCESCRRAHQKFKASNRRRAA